MSIAPAIEQHYPGLNDDQRAIVGHLDGALLVLAGPGSGKTYSIVLRALNLLLLEKAQPKQLALCTFTEKAAFEMRDRLAAAARKVGLHGRSLGAGGFHDPQLLQPRAHAAPSPDPAGPQLRYARRAHAAALHLRTLSTRSSGRRRTISSSSNGRPAGRQLKERAVTSTRSLKNSSIPSSSQPPPTRSWRRSATRIAATNGVS